MQDNATEKDIIKWQYVEYYYPYMIDKLKLIDRAIQLGNQLVAFTEMNTLFIQINHAFSVEKPLLFQEMIELKKEIKKRINILMYMQMSNHHGKVKVGLMSQVMTELNDQIDEFYMKLMSTMDELNMFFPREKKDLRLPIYRQ